MKGFTLIELLVVVLIIGVLAAVAVPQYQLAVEKSRAAEALVIMRKLIEAQNLYFLANGAHTEDINDLDVTIPGKDNFLYRVKRRESQYFSYAVRPSSNEIVIGNRIPADQIYTFLYKDNQLLCRGYSSFGKKVCKNLSEKKVPDGRYETYLID